MDTFVFAMTRLSAGILLVFDNTNSVSYNNLKKWIKEIVEVNRIHPLEESYHKSSSSGSSQDELDSKLGELPVICVGAKYDAAQGIKNNNRAQQILKQYGIDCKFVVRTLLFLRPS
jgi:GTPase SAR1 family protein